ncbi:MAG TPA: [FeFe] hydrogenase H-cluster maturation GTPase HydF [Clostridiales bacterium]|nr:[FeFe] hydrogenase H-cluster maturation GTPase HydF [Clostridiales bacterium]
MSKENMNTVPTAERLHIGFFGMMNAGKSSLVNAVTNQDLAIVSDVKGTTTDPVKKTMELLPLGPVVIIDTPGIDDAKGLGKLRVEKAKKELRNVDIAILVVDSTVGLQGADKEMIDSFERLGIKYIIAFNKADLINADFKASENEIYVSATTKKNINELKTLIGSLANAPKEERKIISDLVEKDDVVVLVTPIDSSAPKGRLILPQQQTIRDLLDNHAITMVCQVEELEKTLSSLKNKPRLVITDSQAFKKVAKIVPLDIPLTSFSIIFARYKGDLETVVKGAYELDNLQDGDTILIAEGCTHHRQCEDIGTVKLPRWILEYTNKKLNFEFTQGQDFPDDFSKYKMVIHCGACMLTQKQMTYRLNLAKANNIPMSNYGISIAHINGILKRSVEPFGL